MNKSAAEDDPSLGERGSGTVSTLFGATVLLFFILLAVQITLALHTRTVVDAVASDAARDVATAGDSGRALASARAEQSIRLQLGDLGDDATIAIQQIAIDGGSAIQVRIAVAAPSALPPALGGRAWNPSISRTAVARVEQLQGGPT